MHLFSLGAWAPLDTAMQYARQVPALFMYLFYRLITAIGYFLIYFPEKFFRLVTGTGDAWTFAGITVGGDSGVDLGLAFLRSEAVRSVFYTVLGFSIVLLIVFTIIAMIRSEFTTDVSKAAKGPIIQRAATGLVNFILVPVLALAFMVGINVLTRVVNSLLGYNSNSTLASYVIQTTVYGASRFDEADGEDFESYVLEVVGGTQNAEIYKKAYEDAQNMTAQNYNTGEKKECIVKYSDTQKEQVSYQSKNYYLLDKNVEEYKPLPEIYVDGIKQTSKTKSWMDYASNGQVGTYGEMVGFTYTDGKFYYLKFDDMKKLAEAFNNYVSTKELVNLGWNESNIKDRVENMFFNPADSQAIADWNLLKNNPLPIDNSWKYYSSNVNGGTYLPWQCALIPFPSSSEMKSSILPIFCPRLVNFFYNPTHFNILMGAFSACIIAWNIVGVSILLIKRGLELAILFMISPIAVALYPLDDGAATKGWRKDFFSRTVAPVAIVFTFNIFFTLMNLLSYNNLTLVSSLVVYTGGLFGLFWNLIVVVCMSSLLKTASGMICKLIGADDLLSKSGEMTKTALGVVGTAAGVTAGVAAPLVRGAASVVGKTAGGLGKTFRGIKDRIGAGKDELAAEDDAYIREKSRHITEYNSERERLSDTAEDKRKAFRKARDKYERIKNAGIIGEPLMQARFDMIDAEKEYNAAKDDVSLLDQTYSEQESAFEAQHKSNRKNIKKTAKRAAFKQSMKDPLIRDGTLLGNARDAVTGTASAVGDALGSAGSWIEGHTHIGKRVKNAASTIAWAIPKNPFTSFIKENYGDPEKAHKAFMAPQDFKKWQKAYNLRHGKERDAEKAGFMEAYTYTSKDLSDEDKKKYLEWKLKLGETKIEAERVDLKKKMEKMEKSVGADKAYKDLFSKNSDTRKAAFDAYHDAMRDLAEAQKVAAEQKNAEEFLRSIGGKLKVQTEMDPHTLDGFSTNLQKIIRQAINEAADKTKGYKDYDPKTKILLEQIKAVGGEIKNVGELLEALKEINKSPMYR